jgi:ribosome-associated protein
VLRWNVHTSRALAPDVKERFLARHASRLTASGDLLITSERHRDQARNADDCVEKLQAMIAAVLVAPTQRRATRPTFGSKMRTLRAKKARSETKKNRRSGWD